MRPAVQQGLLTIVIVVTNIGHHKVCYGPDNSGCKAVVDPGCYQVPTHSPVQVRYKYLHKLGDEGPEFENFMSRILIKPRLIIDEFQVPREICYTPSTGERCDNYNKQFADSYPVRCSQ